MRRAMSETPADRAKFDGAVARVRSRRDDGKFALLVLKDPDQQCSFLMPDRMCDLHRRFGEDLLPNTCAVYPRRPNLVGDRAEIAGSVSCPEVARLALLAHDAMELDDADRGALKRGVFLGVARTNDPDAYTRSLNEVRIALLLIVGGTAPLASRLATLVVLADALQGWFARGKPFEAQRLTSTLAAFTNPAAAAQLATGLASIDVPLEIPTRLLVRAIASRTHFPLGGFAHLLKFTVDAYGVGSEAPPLQIARAYVERRDVLEPKIGERLEQILGNYVANYVFSSWFTEAPDLGVWVRGLAVRVALIRFLVFAHPELASMDRAATPRDFESIVERVAVEVVSKMSRAIEHFAGFLTLLDRELPAVMPGLEHALSLLKL
jgi:lysine-N-methylase